MVRAGEILLPTIKFKLMNQKETCDILFWSLHENETLKKWTKKLYPQVNENMTYQELTDKIQPYYQNFVKENKNIAQEYFSLWNKYHNDFMNQMFKYFHCNNFHMRHIEVGIGNIPICPRNIEEYSFFMHLKNKKQVIETCMHECCHFFFFEKCKEILKETNTDPPNLIWYLSEIVVDPILNLTQIQEVFAYPFKSYDYFYKITLEQKNMMEYMKKIYKENEVEEAIRLSYQYLKENEKEFYKKVESLM